MAPQTRIFTERQFGDLLLRLYPGNLNKYAGWKREITILFTHGKDIAWKFHPNPGNAAGAVSDAFVVKGEKKLCGGAAIDVKQIVEGKVGLSIAIKPEYQVPRPGGPAIPTPKGFRIHSRKPSLKDIRYEVIVVLAHEFFHFIQHWNNGDMKLSRQQYTNIFLRLKEQAKRENPNLTESQAGIYAHARHPWEQSAEKKARQAVARFKTEIDNGGFDHCIPIQDIRWYLENQG
jgi:hypothetical protein